MKDGNWKGAQGLAEDVTGQIMGRAAAGFFGIGFNLVGEWFLILFGNENVPWCVSLE